MTTLAGGRLPGPGGAGLIIVLAALALASALLGITLAR